MRFSEAWALHRGESGKLTHLDVYREPQDEAMSITQQGRQCPHEDIIRVRYLDDQSQQPQYT
jgi:hypothetical protein|tara:strand:+ start:2227 stop:2412 length:186 start_codon:yes stop_codon:yes gene_type:complete